MASGDVTTGGSSTTPNSPQVGKTTDLLLKGLQGAYKDGVDVYNKPLYTAPGATTQNAWAQGSNAANSLISSGGLNDPMRSAMSSFGDIGKGFGAFGANGGLTSAQSGAMSGLSGLGGQYSQHGGLSSAQSNAMSNTSGLAGAYGDLSGAYDQNAPGYARMRQQLLDDAAKNVGAGFTSSGRFGGGSYINDATEASLNAIAPLDYQNYQNNINNQYRSLDSQKGIYDTLFSQGQQGRDNSVGALDAQRGVFGDVFGMGQTGQANSLAALNGQQGAASSLFDAGQTGINNQQGAIGTLGQIGSAQDANSLAKRLADADLYDRKNNADWESLAKASSILGGTAGAAGSSTTNSVPWWSAILGGAATGASIFG